MIGRTAYTIVFGLGVAGCNQEHSVLAPHGPQAQQIAELTWLLSALLIAVCLIVVVAVWLAARGSERLRNRLASVHAVVVGGIVFPAVTLTLLLAYGLWLMRDAPAAPEAMRIEVVGEQWWWRVRYPAGNNHIIERANEIRIPVGQPVVFTLRAADVIHSFWIPSLAGKVDMIPGRTTSLRLSADRPGIYRGICAEYCGGAHAFMALDVVAMPKDDFTSWLLDAERAAQPPDPQHRRGRELFEAAGCGGCHAIDGLAAAGTIGPNLSELGERRSIGAGRLPMTIDNLKRFIVDSQILKPGNGMPPFRIFSGEDLSALASFLSDLK